MHPPQLRIFSPENGDFGYWMTLTLFTDFWLYGFICEGHWAIQSPEIPMCENYTVWTTNMTYLLQFYSLDSQYDLFVTVSPWEHLSFSSWLWRKNSSQGVSAKPIPIPGYKKLIFWKCGQNWVDLPSKLLCFKTFAWLWYILFFSEIINFYKFNKSLKPWVEKLTALCLIVCYVKYLKLISGSTPNTFLTLVSHTLLSVQTARVALARQGEKLPSLEIALFSKLT